MVGARGGGSGYENLLHVVGVVGAGGGRGVHGGLGPGADEGHNEGEVFGTTGSHDFEVKVINQPGAAKVGGGGGIACGVGPGEGRFDG